MNIKEENQMDKKVNNTDGSNLVIDKLNSDVKDNINPNHYKLDPQPINVIESWELGFHLGNTIKYIARYKNKNGIEDLEKARWYLDRYIEKLKKDQPE